MYANLKLEVTDRRTGVTKTLYAWDVDVLADRTVIQLDANNGEGNYAEEAGTTCRSHEHYSINIEASF